MPSADELLRVITEASHMFIAYVDHEQRYRFVNTTYKQHFGGGSHDIIGMRISEVLGDAYEKVRPQIETALAGKLGEHETLIRLADGTPRWLNARLVPHKTQEGQVAGFVVLATDVTERKKAEEALGQSEERFHRVFDHSNDGIFAIDPREDEILDVNPSACSMLGYSRDELLSIPVSAVHPDEMSVLREFASSVLETGSGWTDELTCLTKSGKKLAAEISASALEFKGKACMLALVRDVTERKEAERALRASGERYRGLYNHSPVMMHSIDRTGKLVTVNDHWLNVLGYNRDQVIGRKSVEFLTPESAKRAAEEAIPRVFCEGGVKDLEFQMVKKSGEVIEVMISAVAEHDETGEITHTLAIIVDLTERNKAEQALRESEERLSRILDSAMDAIVIIDTDRKIHLFNAAAEGMFQCSAAEAIGQSFDGFASEELREVMTGGVSALGRRGAGKRYLWAPNGITALRASRQVFPIEATLSQFKAAGETLYTLIIRDVDDRVRAEEELRKLLLENVYLREEIGNEYEFEQIVHAGPQMKCVLDSVQSVAGTDSTVLIVGETGTGKELIARAIHNLSERKDQTMVTVNCVALPEGLIESELFGHEKGAFTGALSQKIGRFELADNSTLFLDEIGDLPVELQAKLLRVLQERAFERVGGTSTINVDVRVIAATNRDLDRAVEEQAFREDLYYRLNVFPIRIPPLRERKEDIPLLVKHFVMRYAAKMGKSIESIPKATMNAMTAYPWPGNIRELQNVIERAVILSQGNHLEAGDWLPQRSLRSGRSGVLSLDRLERQHITEVLEMTGWRVSGEHGAAKLLGIKPTTLEARMKKLGVKRPD